MTGSLSAHVIDGTKLSVTVVSDQGAALTLSGTVDDVTPAVDDDGALASNPALVSNMWAFARSWYESQTESVNEALAVSDPAEQKAAIAAVAARKAAAAKAAENYRKSAQWIADVADDVSPYQPRDAWCSSCFDKANHHKSNRPAGQLPVYVCSSCGSPTLPCAAASCPHMAVRGRGAISVPQFCAEHRHFITGFEKSVGTFGSLYDYEDYLKFEKPNLGRVAKLTTLGAVAAAATAPVALLAAPAIGGALGSLGIFGGYSGAAASSHGLALLGGGAIAKGGLGMAGGTAVITALGSAVGGTVGATVSNAYLREDSSFRIELLRPGSGGIPVIVANGFLTERGDAKWGGWRRLVDTRYEDSPVYRVHWGSKELKNLGVMGAAIIGQIAGGTAVTGAAALATKAGAALVGRTLAPGLAAAEIAKNPWHVAKNRADKTGAILGDLLARTDAQSYVLIGHSLGARIMAVAAEALGSKPGGPRLASVHLFGAAMRAQGDWSSLGSGVDGVVYNYHSSSDPVLKYVYRTAQGGQIAAGALGMLPATPKVVNVDVSERVNSHSAYFEVLELLGPDSDAPLDC